MEMVTLCSSGNNQKFGLFAIRSRRGHIGCARVFMLIATLGWLYPKAGIAQATHSAKTHLDQLAQQLQKRICEIARPLAGRDKIALTVGNFTFANTKIANALSEYLQAELEERLQDAFDIIERTRLDEILKEQGLQASAILDEGTAVPVGKIKGVDVLVRGTYWKCDRPPGLYIKASALSIKDARKKVALVEIPSSSLPGFSIAPSKDEVQKVQAAERLNKLLRIPPKSQFRISLWVDGGKKVFHPNENLVMWFRTTRDCYLVVYDYDCQGYQRCIFPWQGRPSNTFVKAGTTYRVPPPDAGYDLVPVPPYGTEVIQAIASTRPIKVLTNPKTSYRGTRDFEKAITRGFVPVSPDERAETRLILTTVGQ